MSKFFKVEVPDVDPLLLDPLSGCMALSGSSNIGELCRSYVLEREGAAWTDMEAELAFASGLLLPKLQTLHFPVCNRMGRASAAVTVTHTRAPTRRCSNTRSQKRL